MTNPQLPRQQFFAGASGSPLLPWRLAHGKLSGFIQLRKACYDIRAGGRWNAMGGVLPLASGMVLVS